MKGTLRQAIFGSSDGLNAGVAVVFGNRHLLLAFALLISMAGALSMAQGEGVSALVESDRSLRTEMPGIAAMGVFTFAGTMAPTLPAFFLNRTPALVLAVVIGLALAGVVGYFLGQENTHLGRKAYLVSVVSFGVVLVPTVVVAALLGI